MKRSPMRLAVGPLVVVLLPAGVGGVADVFTMLSTYAGAPAYWQIRRLSGAGRVLLTFVRIDGEWVAVDVPGRGGFARPAPTLAPAPPLRAELQMPWSRLAYEARRANGWTRDHGP